MDLMYLSGTIPRFFSKNGMEYPKDSVEEDPFGELFFGGEVRIHTEDSREAKWWAVAVYDVDQAYGGPEEGGWWYDIGHLVCHAMVRFFTDLEEAKEYQKSLREWADANDYRVVGFTETMPVRHYPKTKPIYC